MSASSTGDVPPTEEESRMTIEEIADDVHAIRSYLEELMPVVRQLMSSKMVGFAMKKGVKL